MEEEEALRAEIAKLSGAIQSHKQSYNNPRSQYPPSRAWPPTTRGHVRAAPVAARNRTLILNDSTKKSQAQPSSQTPSQSVGAVSNVSNTQPQLRTPSESQPLTVNQTGTSSASTTNTIGNVSASDKDQGWIKRRTTHNLSLVSSSTFQKTEPARLAAISASQKAKEAKTSWKPLKSNTKAGSSSIRRGDNMGEVVIDGVVFEFDPSGTKLVKKAVQPSSSGDNVTNKTSTEHAGNTVSSSSTLVVPLRTSINGQSYVRTKRGNLISAELLSKRRAQKEQQAKLAKLTKMAKQIGAIHRAKSAGKKTPASNLTLGRPKVLCTFFNKTGQCKRGLSCPYIHDANKLALCPRVLRPKGCTLPTGTCPLSHKIRPERVPHCVHYLRTSSCRNGDNCLYTHSDQLSDGIKTKICSDFSQYGWCDRGKQCTQRHTWECPDFVEKGKCERKGCRLLHIIRATGDEPDIENDTNKQNDAKRGGIIGHLQDGDLFIRDDAAAIDDQDDDDDDEEQTRHSSGSKRKRPLMEMTDQDRDENGESIDPEASFSFISKETKRKKTKSFIKQQDFISFEDQDEQYDSSQEGENTYDDENESVHSEEVESSEEEEEEEGDEEEEESDESKEPNHPPSEAGSVSEDDDYDDELVEQTL